LQANLKALTPEEFQRQCNILMTKKLEKPKHLNELTERYWDEINTQKYLFDRSSLPQ
jgi:hypothetical protein